LRALGAAAGGVMLFREREARLESFVSVGYPPDLLAAWQTMSLSVNLPHAEAARYNQPMWFGRRTVLVRTYPHLEPVLDRLACQALAALPLLVDGHLTGVLHVTFEEERVFGPEERRLCQAVADLLAASLERARAFEDIDTACREAVQALQQRDELLLTATHDLRAPLTGIRMAGQLLRHRLSSSAESSIASSLGPLAEIDAAVGRMSALIDEVLSLTRTRVDPTFLRRNTRPSDLVGLARRVVASVCPDDSDARVVLTAESPTLLGPWDGFKLERVIANLVDNSLKYSPPDSKVQVRVRKVSDAERDWAVLEVADRGVGIPAEELARVFDRFQRASNVADSVPGTGLGLASVRHIVEQHGGSVDVTSLEGDGATFTVRLPLPA
jgi:signal transduction histidine kinase